MSCCSATVQGNMEPGIVPCSRKHPMYKSIRLLFIEASVDSPHHDSGSDSSSLPSPLLSMAAAVARQQWPVNRDWMCFLVSGGNVLAAEKFIVVLYSRFKAQFITLTKRERGSLFLQISLVLLESGIKCQ